MKKVLSLIAIAAFGLSTAFAQVAAPAATAKKSVKQTAKVVKKETKAAVANKADVKAKTTAAGVVLKKDGTPDKRYKAVGKAVGPTKKDGTPDMRYKANKAAAKKG